jgi:putative transposase
LKIECFAPMRAEQGSCVLSAIMASRRLFVPGLSHHVRHRGNNRCDVFKDDDDRRHYLELFDKAARERRVAVHGFVLMSNHVHAVVTASEPDSLPTMMQSLGRSYVRYFNDRHHRTGTLWEGRYWAGLIGDERHWLLCLRYVEMNPVAARMVSCPDAYPWSSYHAHAHGQSNALLTSHPLFLELGPDAAARGATWSLICNRPISNADLAAIRRATRRGTVLGNIKSDPNGGSPSG